MIEHLRAMIILDVNRRRSICSLLNTRVTQLQIFFLPTTSSPLTGFARVALFRSRAIEGWRGVVRSMPMCIDAIDVYTYGEDIYRVCLRIIRMDVTYGLEDGS